MTAFYQLPWRHQHGLILDANGFVVCSIKARDDAPDRKPMNEVGELIVRVVNVHEGLVEACRKARREIDGTKETCDSEVGTLATLDLAIRSAQNVNNCAQHHSDRGEA